MKTLQALGLVLLVLAAFAPSARAAAVASGKGKVFLTVDEALALAFDGCQIERSRLYLSNHEQKRVEKLGNAGSPARVVYAYRATKDGQHVGTAYFDNHKVRTLKETVMIVVDPDETIRRIEVLAFAEPLDYLPRGSWYAQFAGKGLADGLELKRGIRGVTGATLTARATAEAARRSLALHRVLADRAGTSGGAPAAR